MLCVANKRKPSLWGLLQKRKPYKRLFQIFRIAKFGKSSRSRLFTGNWKVEELTWKEQVDVEDKHSGWMEAKMSAWIKLERRRITARKNGAVYQTKFDGFRWFPWSNVPKLYEPDEEDGFWVSTLDTCESTENPNEIR